MEYEQQRRDQFFCSFIVDEFIWIEKNIFCGQSAVYRYILPERKDRILGIDSIHIHGVAGFGGGGSQYKRVSKSLYFTK